jgi:hypothetical protein
VTKEVLALALTVLVHIIGMGALVWALLRDEQERPDWRSWFGGGDDDGPGPGPAPGGGPLPLEDAEPSPVRLREPGRLADGYPTVRRRPRHDPRPAPQRTPSVGD